MNQFQIYIEWENNEDDKDFDLRSFPEEANYNYLDVAFSGNILINIDNISIGYFQRHSNGVIFKEKVFLPGFQKFLPHFVKFALDVIMLSKFNILHQNTPFEFDKTNFDISNEDISITITNENQNNFSIESYDFMNPESPKIKGCVEISNFISEIKRFTKKARDFLVNLNNPGLWKEEWFLFTRDAFDLFNKDVFDTLPQMSVDELEPLTNHENFALNYYANVLYNRLKFNESYSGNFYGFGI